MGEEKKDVYIEKKYLLGSFTLCHPARANPLYLDAFLPLHPILSQQNSLVITKETRLRVASQAENIQNGEMKEKNQVILPKIFMEIMAESSRKNKRGLC